MKEMKRRTKVVEVFGDSATVEKLLYWPEREAFGAQVERIC